MLISNNKSYIIESPYKDTNLSFSGCDMIATANISIGLTGDSYFVTLGSIQTISYSIHMEKAPVRSLGNVNAKDYIYGQRTIAGSLVFAVFNRHVFYELFEKIRDRYPNYLQNKNIVMDEIPPFDITISYANEYGIKANMALYGIRIINEGQTMSINDIYTENTYQFVATDIEYLNSNEVSGSIDKGKIITQTATEKIIPIDSGYDNRKIKKYNLEIIRDYDLEEKQILYKVNVSIDNYDNSLDNSLSFRIVNQISNPRKIIQEKNNIFVIPKEYEPKENGISQILILEGEEIVYHGNISLMPINDSDNYIKYKLYKESYSDIVVMDKTKDYISIYINKAESKNKIVYINNVNNIRNEINIEKNMKIPMPDISGAPYLEDKYYELTIDSLESKVLINDIANFDEIGKRIENNIVYKNDNYNEMLSTFIAIIEDKIRTVNIFEEAVKIYSITYNDINSEEKFHIMQSFQKEMNDSLIIDNKNYINKLNQREISVKKNIGQIIIKDLYSKKIEKIINNNDLISDIFKSNLGLKNDNKYLLELRDHFNNVVQFAYLFVPSEELMKSDGITKFELYNKINIISSKESQEGDNIYQYIIIDFPKDIDLNNIEDIYVKHDGNLIIEQEEQGLIEVENLTKNIIKIKRLIKEYDMLKINDNKSIEIYLNIDEGGE